MNTYVIWSKSKLPNEAWQLVKMLTSFDAAKWMAINKNIGPGSVVKAWNDPEVHIAWPLPNPVVSDRDRNLPALSSYR